MLRLIARVLGIRQLLRAISVKRELGIMTRIMADSYIRENLVNNPKYDDPKKLNRYETQVYSQNGEDGIIEEIFNRIGVTNSYFVEFGAGDGLQNNTACLLAKGWRGHWIESDQGNAEKIRRTYGFMIEGLSLSLDPSMVSAENIETLFRTATVPQEFDVLSIDIDGNDYWVWKSIESFHPRAVVIEYNAHYPPPLKWVQKYDTGRVWDGTSYFGASLKSLELLGGRRGYCLVGCDFAGVNAFFVREDLVGDRFCKPFTAENHYESPRYFLSGARGHKANFGEFLSI